jgi:hypothetical protein
MAVLKPRGNLKKTAVSAAKVEAADPGRFRVCVATYVARHKTKAEASAYMKSIKLGPESIAFIVEEK